MAVSTNTMISNIYSQNYTQNNKGSSKTSKASETTEVKKEEKVTESKDYGKTIGDPTLSKEAQKYYERLKKKYGNYDFILVSADQKANAQANAAKYANNVKTVVLIDEDKIEKMATDENYRKKYEGILSGATAQLAQLKTSIEKSGANVQGYGMQVNDGGTTSFFAVLKKSSADQKARLEKTAAKKKAEKKAAEKKAEKKKEQERLEKTKDSKIDDTDDSDTITISAGSMDELMKKIEEYTFSDRSNSIQTESEKMMGQHVDFKL